MSTVIKVDKVSKQYRLGQVGTGSLSHDINRFWHRVRGKEDPYLTVGETNDRTQSASGQYVWALKDVDFEVQRGEVVGIIGRNGAGKSTLLKILSRTTTPSIGKVQMKGRVASLLEVGTGFNPELSGRENILLNGAIMGMSRRETLSKFDEIVDFAGVAKYIDTPVKRYSSGMFVRLGFAVAAHLEPEILIVDEVLAVGDFEFQKKCLGKMQEVSSQQGRTILFVSHNMTAIKNLCDRAIILQHGSVKADGPCIPIVKKYGSVVSEQTSSVSFDMPESAPGNEKIRVKKMALLLPAGTQQITVNTPVDIEFEFWNQEDRIPLNLSLHLYTANQECVFNVGTPSLVLPKGLHRAVCRIPASLLNDNLYTATMMVVGEKSYAVYNFEQGIQFEIVEDRPESGWHGKWPGIIRPKIDFIFEPAGVFVS